MRRPLHSSTRPPPLIPVVGRGLEGAPQGWALFAAVRSPRRSSTPAGRWSFTGRSSTRGGHFAAMEEPELLVGDIRKFFSDLR